MKNDKAIIAAFRVASGLPLSPDQFDDLAADIPIKRRNDSVMDCALFTIADAIDKIEEGRE